MKAGLAALASVVLCGTATPTPFAVGGLAVGTQLSFDNALYGEYRCSPSDQFDGLTWCQKTRNERERRGSYTATYSILHSPDGNVLYVDRYQEPAFFSANEADEDIRRYSRKIGESPRIMRMPHRTGLPNGIIAVWGEIRLERLDREVIGIVADRRRSEGLLIDFLGDFVRSVNEDLPIYRIEGGPGFLSAASFDQKGRGTLRLTAVDTSGFHPSPRPGQQPIRQSTVNEAEPEEKRPETIDILKSELATAAKAIAEVEKALRGLDADGTVIDVKYPLYGSIGGLLAALVASAIGVFVNRRRARVSKQQVCELEIEAAKSRNIEAEIGPLALSPEIAISETEFGRELQEQVSAINAAQDVDGGQWRVLSPRPRLEVIWKSSRRARTPDHEVGGSVGCADIRVWERRSSGARRPTQG
jgi:hypothetical protein